jgi:hypothetical protein
MYEEAFVASPVVAAPTKENRVRHLAHGLARRSVHEPDLIA